MTRRLLALAAAAAAVAACAPQASAYSEIGKCVVEHNRVGFPYGGTYVDPTGTVLCIV